MPWFSGAMGRAGLTGAILILGAIALYFFLPRRDARTQGGPVKSLAVLPGRVQQRGNTLVVHADLVNIETGAQLWGDKYNRKLSELVSVEEEIATAISDKLRPRLTSEVQRRVTKLSTGNPEAYRSYLRGRYVWNKRSKESLTKGIEYFERAIELDPSYALAWAGLADAHSLLAFYAYAPWKESYAKAEAAALKAILLDDQLAEAHAALGNLRLENWEFLSAEKELKQAIALNPNYAIAHNWYGLYLNWIAHLDQAMAEYSLGQQLDPASSLYGSNLGGLLCQLGQCRCIGKRSMNSSRWQARTPRARYR